jgi:small subunit ribosomal protein S17
VESNRPNKKTLVGVVLSAKMDKTVTVLLETRKRHPLYKKFVKELSKIKAHDEKNQAAEGDLVKVLECRPISKEKTWRLTGILEKKEERG